MGVDWNRTRLIEGHEEDAVGNLEFMDLQETGGDESVTVGNETNLGSDPRELHQFCPSLQQWLVAQT